MNKLLGTILFSVIFFGLFVTSVSAADVEMTCNPNGCQQVGAIFNENGIAPGQTIYKTLKITNGFGNWRSFALEIQGSNYSDSVPSMGDALTITMMDTTNNVVIFGPETVTQWKNDGFKSIGGFDPGASRDYRFEVYFNEADNTYQNQKLTFDLKLGFEDVGAGVPVNITAPVNTGVLGAFTNFFNIPSPTPETQPYNTPQVLGTECVKSITPWWIFLILEILAFILIIRRARVDKWGRIKFFLALGIVAMLTQIAHLATGCDCIVSIWCERFWILNLILLSFAIIEDRIDKRI